MGGGNAAGVSSIEKMTKPPSGNCLSNLPLLLAVRSQQRGRESQSGYYTRCERGKKGKSKIGGENRGVTTLLPFFLLPSLPPPTSSPLPPCFVSPLPSSIFFS